jgi:hypothetical protein
LRARYHSSFHRRARWHERTGLRDHGACERDPTTYRPGHGGARNLAIKLRQDGGEEALMPQRLGAAHWRKRAEEARTLAEQMDDSDAKRSMRTIATEYDKLTERAEKRAQKVVKGELREG